MKKILVTGANGQLGLCLKELSKNNKTLDFIFLDSSNLDITNPTQIDLVFNKYKVDYCINCAAYTAVDKAEEEFEKAHNVNVIGVKYLAESCKKYNVTLIHISTDFVFNGSKNLPYNEQDITKPLGVYGSTKLEGENHIVSILNNYYIIRTSWLYSKHKFNFVKTMLRLANEREELNVVNDQTGTPTNGLDLAQAIIKIIILNQSDFGVYHYSNLGETTWYSFAKAIFEFTNTKIKLNPVSSNEFVTKTERPKYSVLDKTKISTVFSIKIPEWKQSLKTHLKDF